MGRLVALCGTMAVAAVVAAGCGEGGGETRVASEVGPQLAYLDPRAGSVVAIDLRYGEGNWKHVRAIASRALRAYRSQAGPERAAQVPPNLTGALNMLAGYAGLSFEDDVEPLLDGYLVVGTTFPPRAPLTGDLAELEDVLRDAYVDPAGRVVRPTPGGVERVRHRGRPVSVETFQSFQRARAARERKGEPRTIAVYRSPGGDLRRVVEKVVDGAEVERLEGHDDVRVVEDGLALVGDDTLVAVLAGPGGRAELVRAVERGQRGRGYPAARLAAAERAAGAQEPLALFHGNLDMARQVVEEDGLRRARERVPWLRALRGVSGALTVDEDGLSGVLRASTDARSLRDEDLPVAKAGRIEVPAGDLVVGASRDQSVTTTFAARVARELFADSRFVRAVESTERDLGIRFEDEVLRQFDCPSISLFDARSQRFGARSCLRDPARMRRLLPRLRPHLPRILTGLQGLGSEGLVGLLLVAPDAPLTPAFVTHLAAIAVKPLRPGDERGADAPEELYEITGLRDDPASPIARAGPDRVVFGMVGDRFVVASDLAMARRAAAAEATELGAPAASAVRAPFHQIVRSDPQADADVTRVVGEVFDRVEVTAAADRAALTVRARLGLAD